MIININIINIANINIIYINNMQKESGYDSDFKDAFKN